MIHLFLLNVTILNGQIKVAILDFENTSTIEKYDGFGKAMSNMLLTDLKNNIHPRKISFLERSQLNKILNEQQLQNTKNFDKNTAVTFGKLAGVKYVILGSVYVLDGVCNLNSRMVDVESSEIIYAKESSGKITDWLNIKTRLAEELSSELNNPIQIDEEYTNIEVNEGTISQYSKVIELLESGELDKANDFINLLKSVQPEFKYYDELHSELKSIKQQLEKIEQDVEVTTTDPYGAGKNYDELGNYKEAEKYFLIGLNRLKKHEIGSYLFYNLLLSELSFKYLDFEKSIIYSNQVLKVYPLFDQAISFKAQSLLELNKHKEFIEWSKKYLIQANNIGNASFFESSLNDFKLKNTIDERINDFQINDQFTWFYLDLANYRFRLGDVELFNFVLGNFTQINSKLYGIDSTLNYLENLNSSTPIFNSYEYITGPRFLPSWKYETKVTNPREKLLIPSSGKLYDGSYHRDYEELLWTNSSPSECPCSRLLTEKEYMMINQSYIEKDWQIYPYTAEGWYSLLKKDYRKSRKRFGKIIYYLIHDKMSNYDKLFEFIDNSIVDLDINKPQNGYQGLRDIINLESANYKGDQNLNFLKALTEMPIVYNSGELCNTIINFAHSYLIEDNFEEALRIYKYLNPDHFIKDFNLTVEQVINNDLSEFENKGLIEKGVLVNIMNAL